MRVQRFAARGHVVPAAAFSSQGSGLFQGIVLLNYLLQRLVESAPKIRSFTSSTAGYPNLKAQLGFGNNPISNRVPNQIGN